MSGPGEDRERFAAFLLRMRSRGLDQRDLMSAIETTPRRAFLPTQWQAEAWSDRMLPIECGEAIEGLDLQAQVLAALNLEAGQRVLEIGTGSGYTAALLGRLAGKVLSVDRFRTLTDQATQRLSALEISNVICRQADGSGGMAADGPYDRIIAWAAFETLPRMLVDQLATGGIAIAPIGPGDGIQSVARLAKLGSRFERTDIAFARLQPLVPGLARAI
jgi:protein-L-isoaspartate(D-aspartate) O-methyltransferase